MKNLAPVEVDAEEIAFSVASGHFVDVVVRTTEPFSPEAESSCFQTREGRRDANGYLFGLAKGR
jgi:hypothetical protein